MWFDQGKKSFVPVSRIFLPWTISQDFLIKFSISLCYFFFLIIEANTKGAEPMSVDQEQKQDDKSKDPQATGTFVHSL